MEGARAQAHTTISWKPDFSRGDLVLALDRPWRSEGLRSCLGDPSLPRGLLGEAAQLGLWAVGSLALSIPSWSLPRNLSLWGWVECSPLWGRPRPWGLLVAHQGRRAEEGTWGEPAVNPGHKPSVFLQ